MKLQTIRRFQLPTGIFLVALFYACCIMGSIHSITPTLFFVLFGAVVLIFIGRTFFFNVYIKVQEDQFKSLFQGICAGKGVLCHPLSPDDAMWYALKQDDPSPPANLAQSVNAFREHTRTVLAFNELLAEALTPNCDVSVPLEQVEQQANTYLPRLLQALNAAIEARNALQTLVNPLPTVA